MSQASPPSPDTAPPATLAPQPRALTVASWLLRLAVLGHAIALFAMVFSARQTQFGNYLFMDLLVQREDPHAEAVLIERITVSLYLAMGVLTLIKPLWPVLLLMAAYAFIEAASATHNAGYRFSDWAIPSQALRFGAPLVLMLLVLMPKIRLLAPWTPTAAASLLRVLVATVFFAHGYQALMANPRFIDLIIGTFANMLDTRITEAQATTMLHVIAIVDFCVAAAILIYPRPLLVPRRLWASPCRICAIRRVIVPVLCLWLALWGLLTAASRMTSLGHPEMMSEYVEVVVRTSHVLGPLALWGLFSATYGPRACAAMRGSKPATASRADEPTPATSPTATPPSATPAEP